MARTPAPAPASTGSAVDTLTTTALDSRPMDEPTLVARPDLGPGVFTLVAAGDHVPDSLRSYDRMPETDAVAPTPEVDPGSEPSTEAATSTATPAQPTAAPPLAPTAAPPLAPTPSGL